MSIPQGDIRRFNLIRRMIYVLIGLVVVVFCLVDITQTFEPSPLAKKVYDKIDSMKPGDHVLLSFDYDPSSEAELQPMALALLRHCFKKGVIPVVMTHWVSGLNLDKMACEEAIADANSHWNKKIVSGRDYVFLGYRPGFEQLVLHMNENIKTAFNTDYFGQPTEGMKALEGVNSLKNFALIVDLAAGNTVEVWIAYGSDKVGVPFAAGTTAVMAPDLYPWVQSHQMIGFLGGLRGAADYEAKLDFPGRGIRGMPAQSATHVLIVLLILGANARMLAGRFLGKKKG
jgi:hypothetical protein